MIQKLWGLIGFLSPSIRTCVVYSVWQC